MGLRVMGSPALAANSCECDRVRDDAWRSWALRDDVQANSRRIHLSHHGSHRSLVNLKRWTAPLVVLFIHMHSDRVSTPPTIEGCA